MKVAVDEKTARDIMGSNVVGARELRMIGVMKLAIGNKVPKIPYSFEELIAKKDDYILILGVSKFIDGSSVTIRAIIRIGMRKNFLLMCLWMMDGILFERMYTKRAEEYNHPS